MSRRAGKKKKSFVIIGNGHGQKMRRKFTEEIEKKRYRKKQQPKRYLLYMEGQLHIEKQPKHRFINWQKDYIL